MNIKLEGVENEKSEIAQWYADKCILVTGATGFMGKVLVEKLLRSCSDVKTIYLLIRSKKGVDPTMRKEQYFKCVIFNKILEKNPNIINKIQVVKGDVLDCNLGLSVDDINELSSNVDMIFHCAANVRFDQPLRPMVQMNVAGTLKVLQLAEKVCNLKAFVHVSTSYCQCNESVLEERAYPAPNDPYEIMDMVNSMDDRALAEVTPKLLNGLPNTYAYSKALSEDLINRYGNKLPIIITRPSIVTAAIKEPLPGWIEGVNGPTGLMMGAARGVIRSMHCNPEYASTIIPVDKAINGIIIAGYDRGQSKTNQTQFCNICISSKALFSWGESIETGKRFFYENPLSYCLWYPNGSIKKNYYHHLLSVIFFHYLPAYFIDFWLLLFGQKPFLIRVQNKVSTGLKLLQYYTTKDWDFRNERFQHLSANLNQTDQDIFDTSVSQVNWEQYIRLYIIGMRTYILGESEDTLPRAKKLLQKLYILDRFTTFTFYGLVFWFLWAHLDSFVERSDELIRSSLLVRFGMWDTEEQWEKIRNGFSKLYRFFFDNDFESVRAMDLIMLYSFIVILVAFLIAITFTIFEDERKTWDMFMEIIKKLVSGIRKMYEYTNLFSAENYRIVNSETKTIISLCKDDSAYILNNDKPIEGDIINTDQTLSPVKRTCTTNNLETKLAENKSDNIQNIADKKRLQPYSGVILVAKRQKLNVN